MGFDPKKPENQPIVEFMASCKCLVIDPASSSRNTLRKLVGAMGAKNANIDTAETFEDARGKIKNQQPDIIFCEYGLGKSLGTELIEDARAAARDPLELIFIVVSEKNSPVVTSTVAEKDADALILKPFTYAVCEEELLDVLLRKMSLTEYDRKVDEGRKLIQSNVLSKAEELLTASTSMSDEPTLAYFWLSVCQRKQGKRDHALESLKAGLKVDPENYKCLFGLFDLYNEVQEYALAYETATAITSHYPIPIPRIPEFVHLSIRNRKFDDILGFYELFSSIEGADDLTSQYVAAGFVIYAKFLVRKGENDAAAEALKKATHLCRGKVAIQKEIAITYMLAGRLKEGELLLGELPEEIRNAPEIMIAIMEFYIKTKDQGQVVQMGADLMRKGIGTPKIFIEVIRESVAIRRPLNALQGLVECAIAKFPNDAESFKNEIKPAIEAEEAEKAAKEKENASFNSDDEDDE